MGLLSLGNIIDAAKTANDVAGVVNDLDAIEQAKQKLGTACDDYIESPTAENRAIIRDDFQDYKDALAEGVGGGLNNAVPGSIGDALDALGVNPIGDLIKGLDDKYNNTGDANADRVSDMLGDLSRISSEDKARCSHAEGYFKQGMAYRPPPRRDPLALDLDGDGIETVAASAGVLFDHDGNGIKTASGWIKGDDGFLVWDRNGNGTIDDGSELFGAD